MPNKKIIFYFITVAVILVVFMAGLITGMQYPSVNLSNFADFCPISKNKDVAIKTKFDAKSQKGLIPFLNSFAPNQTNISSVSGEIKKINNNTIELSIPNYYRGGDFFAYLKEPDEYFKKVIINNDTKIISNKLKDSKTIEKERGAAHKKNETMFIPSPFEEILMNLSDLKEGMNITVETTLEFNLKDNIDLTAKKIILPSINSGM